MVSPSNDKYPPRFMADKNRKYITRSPKGKKITTNQRRLSRTSLSNTHNLQEQGKSDGETNHIPTIINGITNTTHTPQSNIRSNMSVCNLLNELRETIKVNSRELCPLSKKHKVVLIGDSNTRGCVYKSESLLNNNYELYSIINTFKPKPEQGSVSSNLLCGRPCPSAARAYIFAYVLQHRRVAVGFGFLGSVH